MAMMAYASENVTAVASKESKNGAINEGIVQR